MAFKWFLLTILFIVIQAFYSMLEMAAVSFDKARLHYFVKKGKNQARWLSFLLEKPGRLFGTTLILVNVALQFGSECSRQFYQALGVSANYAPLSQVVLVVIFAELSPMLAARRYSEHVVMLGIPIIYFTSRILTPVIWFINGLARLVNRLFSKVDDQESSAYFTRDELQYVFGSEVGDSSNQDAFNRVLSNIFKFREKTARQVMDPLNTVQLLPSNGTVGYLRATLSQSSFPFVPIFHKQRNNIIGIVFPRDVVALPANQRLRDHMRAPWFLSHDTPIADILQQFKNNRQSAAIVINKSAQAIGLLALSDIIDEIFDEESLDSLPTLSMRLFEKKVSGSMTVFEFNTKFNASIEEEDSKTLNQILENILSHPPEQGETVVVDNFEFKVIEATLRGAKLISVRTIN